MENRKDIIAIVGPTASGKSDLAISLAKKIDGVILSVDSLSVYKEIDIASAKPSKNELSEILHFGVDLIYPNKSFDVTLFLNEYKMAKEYAKKNKKALIIVGGTSFYLKVLTQGISPMPEIDSHVQAKVKEHLKNLEKAYNFLKKIDLEYAKKIKPKDKYRIEKALNIYEATKIAPSDYFNQNPAKAIEPNLKIYEIKTNRELLREKIALRTKKMLQTGLIDEVAFLEKKYTRRPNSMKAIGIKESLEYLDGVINKNELFEKIVTNTARLAKRQVTFNKTQLDIAFSGNSEEIYKLITS